MPAINPNATRYRVDLVQDDHYVISASFYISPVSLKHLKSTSNEVASQRVSARNALARQFERIVHYPEGSINGEELAIVTLYHPITSHPHSFEGEPSS